MRLGILMAGAGVGALAGIGALKTFERIGVNVHAVCGMDMGAYPAALWACAMRAQDMLACVEEARRRGERLIDRDTAGLVRGHAGAVVKGKRLARLMAEQTQGMALQEIRRNAAFVCMAVPSRKTVVFSPQSAGEGDGVWTSHAPVWFAARAALGAPPLLRAASFVGIPLCAHPDVREGVRALYALGATHVAAVYPLYARDYPRNLLEMDAWEKGALLDRTLCGVRQIRVEIPEYVRALSFDEIPACIRAGERTCLMHDWRAWEREAGTVLPFERRP